MKNVHYILYTCYFGLGRFLFVLIALVSISLLPSLQSKGGGMRDMEEIKKTKAREIVLLLRFNEVMARERNR
jgi:hypothetical protein